MAAHRCHHFDKIADTDERYAKTNMPLVLARRFRVSLPSERINIWVFLMSPGYSPFLVWQASSFSVGTPNCNQEMES
jgi:hypothetical protein